MALRNLIAELEPLARNPILLAKASGQLREADDEKTTSQLEELKDKVKKVIKSQPLAYSDYAQFVSYSESGYTKNLVHNFNNLSNLIIMCWAPGQSSLWHAHEGSRCFVRVLYGRLLEQQAPLPAQGQAAATPTPLEVSSRTLCARDDKVHYIDDSIGLHKVRNLSSESGAVTLHFYAPAYAQCRLFECQQDQDQEVAQLKWKSRVTLLHSKVAHVLFDNNNYVKKDS